MKKVVLASILIGIVTATYCIADVVVVGSGGQAKYENSYKNTMTTTTNTQKIQNTKFKEGKRMSNEEKKQEFERILKEYNYVESDINKIIQVISFDKMPSQFTSSFYTTLEKGYLKYNPTKFERIQIETVPYYKDVYYGLINDLFSNENANLLYIKIIEQLKTDYSMSDDIIKDIMNNNPIFSIKKDTNSSLKTMSEILDFMKGEGYKETDFTQMYDIYKIYDATIKDSSVSNKKQAFNNSLKQYIKRVNNFSQQQKMKENVSAPGLIFNTIFKDAFKR